MNKKKEKNMIVMGIEKMLFIVRFWQIYIMVIIVASKNCSSFYDMKTMDNMWLLKKLPKEIDKSIKVMKELLLENTNTKANTEIVAKVILEACKIDVLELMVQKIQQYRYLGDGY